MREKKKNFNKSISLHSPNICCVHSCLWILNKHSISKDMLQCKNLGVNVDRKCHTQVAG